MPYAFKSTGMASVLVLLTACGGADGDPGTKGPHLSGNTGGGLLSVEGLWTGQSGGLDALPAHRRPPPG